MYKLFQMIRQWQRRIVAARNLSLLDDRVLADIGIARGDIKPFLFDRQDGATGIRKGYDSA